LQTGFTAVFFCTCVWLSTQPYLVSAAVPRDTIRQAISNIEAGNYSLARTYLDALVIDPRISARQRSRAYYFRGYSYDAQNLAVSATQDYLRALEFDSGNLDALVALAEHYRMGQGVPQNAEKAFSLDLRAARGGQVTAEAQVGVALLSGQGTAVDEKKARYWLSQAAEKNHIGAMLYLARSYRKPYLEKQGLAQPPEPELAREWYQKAADLGAVEAWVGLAYMYENGEFSQSDPPVPDWPDAVRYFTQAAELGSPVAQTRLAHLYLAGQAQFAGPGTPDTGITQSDRLAHTWFQRAANQNFAPAYLGLAFLYQNGRGVAKNPVQARQWLLKGAQQGDLESQIRLAEELLGEGGLKNTREALTWLQSAAGQGSNRARNDLAWLLSTTRFDALRNADQALQVAQLAVNHEASASYLDTLAAAQAEAGNFQAAILVQRQALNTLQQQQTSQPRPEPEFERLLTELETHLQAYQQGKPWRE